MNGQQSLFDERPTPQAVARQFNAPRGARQRDAGLALTATANEEFVSVMREYAQAVSSKFGEVHIDSLREYAMLCGIEPVSSNAWGAIFRCKGWQQTGEYRASALVTNRGHRSPVWRWVGEQ